jgi:hypothetical protein
MDALLTELRGDAAVSGARALERRALDPQSAMALIQVASGVLGVATTAWGLVERIRKALNARKIVGTHLTLPNGTRVDIDKIDAEQLQALIGGAGKGV